MKKVRDRVIYYLTYRLGADHQYVKDIIEIFEEENIKKEIKK